MRVLGVQSYYKPSNGDPVGPTITFTVRLICKICMKNDYLRIQQLSVRQLTIPIFRISPTHYENRILKTDFPWQLPGLGQP